MHEIPKIPEIPPRPDLSAEQALWAALIDREDIYAIANRLGLEPSGSPESWRIAALRIAKAEAFWSAKPVTAPLQRSEWEKWRQLKESPRAMFSLLRRIVGGTRIWRAPTDGRH